MNHVYLREKDSTNAMEVRAPTKKLIIWEISEAYENTPGGSDPGSIMINPHRVSDGVSPFVV